jgi:hypothetical protein
MCWLRVKGGICRVMGQGVTTSASNRRNMDRRTQKSRVQKVILHPTEDR